VFHSLPGPTTVWRSTEIHEVDIESKLLSEAGQVDVSNQLAIDLQSLSFYKAGF
jgi:hypothetical protein